MGEIHANPIPVGVGFCHLPCILSENNPDLLTQAEWLAALQIAFHHMTQVVAAIEGAAKCTRLTDPRVRLPHDSPYVTRGYVAVRALVEANVIMANRIAELSAATEARAISV